MSLKVQCACWQVEEANKLLERVLALNTAAYTLDSKGGKTPTTRLKQKKADVKAVLEQSLVEVDG